jgi:3-methyladenine DNA glycosylase AlkD
MLTGAYMIQERLFALQDEKYREFQRSLIPGLSKEKIIGIRMPAMRKLAKEFVKEPEAAVFLKQLPHTYYDENILHALLIAEIKDYDACMEAVEAFLPYIDNWAVCDGLSPKVFGKHKAELLEKIRLWIPSEHIYTCRFGIGMLMRWFLDEDFQPGYLELPAAVRSEEYYVNMMTAWFFATALAKQWDAAISYLEQNRLDPWTHNKTIQKARESYRITTEQKEYLKRLKVIKILRRNH